MDLCIGATLRFDGLNAGDKQMNSWCQIFFRLILEKNMCIVIKSNVFLKGILYESIRVIKNSN